MRHVELFSGIGGFRQAMRLLSQDHGPRFDCVAYSEIDQAAVNTYRANFDTWGEIAIGDISTFAENDAAMDAIPNFNLVTGGFPCQSFSMMGAKLGFADARGSLFFSMCRLIEHRHPRFLLLENVKNLKTHDGGRTYQVIIQSLEQLGYRTWSDIFNTSHFGLPQTRNRIYIFAARGRIPRGFDFSQELVCRHFEGLQNTSILRFGNTSDLLSRNVPNKYFLSDRIKRTILSNGTGGFVSRSEIDLPVARPLCATMAKMHRACQDNYYSSIFIRSNGRTRFVGTAAQAPRVPIRRLMPEEAFLLQGFDLDFVNRSRQMHATSDCNLYKQAGNAVSVNVAYAILSYLAHRFQWR